MNLELTDEKNNGLLSMLFNEEQLENNKSLGTNETDLNLTNSISEKDLNVENEKNSPGVDYTINDITNSLEKNIEKEMDNLKLDDSIFEKISKSEFMNVVKVGIESVIKGVLKKKFKINYSTFNDAKATINEAMDGNLKDAIKKGTDVAIDGIKKLSPTIKTAIKNVKNSVIDKVIDSEKYEIVNKQTKLLNRISENCEQFESALKINDATKIKKFAKSIKNDMEKILPIRETIVKAQNALDKYSLWENKGKEALTVEENELVEKLNMSA